MFTLISRFPHKFNNSLVVITKGNAEAQYRNSIMLLTSLLAEISILLLYIQHKLIEGGLNNSGTLGIAFLPIFVTSILIIFPGNIKG